MPKPFITYQQQIALLKSKNLIIPDDTEAERILADLGYFTLIGGYKHPFKNRTTKRYKDGVSFNDIVKLYNSVNRLLVGHSANTDKDRIQVTRSLFIKQEEA